jgi:DNA-binding CsgD family transcriptional regulator
MKNTFEAQIKQGYRTVMSNAEKKNIGKYSDYYEVISGGNPRIAFGFFRRENNSGRKKFSGEEKEIIDTISLHIFTLLRTVLRYLRESPSIDYYATFMKICASLARRYNLSGREAILLPEILFGMSNGQIAKKHFVSLATIKTHLRHIFKKTGTKNRVDFISKFFTSPDAVTV